MQARPHDRAGSDEGGGIGPEEDLWPGERGRHGGVDEIPLPLPAGRLWLCGKHFVAPSPDAALDAVGADHVVCLCEEDELARRYPGYPPWLLSSPRAVWFPVPDLHAPPVGEVLPLLGCLRAELADGQGILMHCGAGIGRAGTLAAALLMTLGLPRSEAVATVGMHRPMAGPEAGAQEELLVRLATILAARTRHR